MHTEPVYSVAFSPDGKHVASGSFDKRVRVWEIAIGLLEKTHEAKAGLRGVLEPGRDEDCSML